MLSLTAFEDPPQQGRVLRRVVEYFSDDARVEALVLSGSLAQGAGDAWSDVDVYIVASDAAFDDVFAERNFTAASIASPLAQFTVMGVGSGSSDQIVLYDDLVKLDLMYYRSSEVVPHRKWAHALVLRDTHGLMGEVQQRSRGLPVAALTDEELLLLDQQFWVWCWYALGKIKRGERWAALDAVHEIRTAAVIPLLLSVREEHNEGYRRLEVKLQDDADALALTVATLEPESQMAALRQEITLFTTARAALFGVRGLEVNEVAEAAILSALA